MREILVATKNEHKTIEFKKMLEPLGYKVLTLFDFDLKKLRASLDQDVLAIIPTYNEKENVDKMAHILMETYQHFLFRCKWE